MSGDNLDPAVILISHPSFEEHETGAGHPERPGRLHAIRAALRSSGLDDAIARVEAPAATRVQLERVHDADYLDRLAAMQPVERLTHLDPDTAIGPRSYEAALRAAGAAVRAVDLVMTGPTSVAFCPVRPPGHHAEPGRAMGFCLFNNVAIGAAHALAQHRLERVAIADFDVHQGNGTEVMFAGDARVRIASAYQHPFYPFGPHEPADNIVRVPFASGADSAAFRDGLREGWLPALREFAPELVLIAAGFDGHEEDVMSGTRWTEEDFAWITGELRAVADAAAGGRIVSVLEGGYALDALGRSVVAHLKALR